MNMERWELRDIKQLEHWVRGRNNGAPEEANGKENGASERI
jgi:hypothetical protein